MLLLKFKMTIVLKLNGHMCTICIFNIKMPSLCRRTENSKATKTYLFELFLSISENVSIICSKLISMANKQMSLKRESVVEFQTVVLIKYIFENVLLQVVDP